MRFYKPEGRDKSSPSSARKHVRKGGLVKSQKRLAAPEGQTLRGRGAKTKVRLGKGREEAAWDGGMVFCPFEARYVCIATCVAAVPCERGGRAIPL